MQTSQGILSQQQGGEPGACRKEGAPGSRVNCAVNHAARGVGTLLHPVLGQSACVHLQTSLKLMYIRISSSRKFSRGIRFQYQAASKQMDSAFLWRRSNKVKCHMSREGISNLMLNRQKQHKIVNCSAEISGVNIERSSTSLCLAREPSPPHPQVFKVHLCEMLAFVAGK